MKKEDEVSNDLINCFRAGLAGDLTGAPESIEVLDLKEGNDPTPSAVIKFSYRRATLLWMSPAHYDTCHPHFHKPGVYCQEVKLVYCMPVYCECKERKLAGYI